MTVLAGCANPKNSIDIKDTGDIDQQSTPDLRVPAEWEPQEAIWMQWPGYWEKDYEITFVDSGKIEDLMYGNRFGRKTLR